MKITILFDNFKYEPTQPKLHRSSNGLGLMDLKMFDFLFDWAPKINISLSKLSFPKENI